MSAKQDIEADIGKNGWRLVSKIAAIVLLPSFGLAGWVGAVDRTVDINTGEIATLRQKVDVRSETQAAILQELKNINRQLSELRGERERP